MFSQTLEIKTYYLLEDQYRRTGTKTIGSEIISRDNQSNHLSSRLLPKRAKFESMALDRNLIGPVN